MSIEASNYVAIMKQALEALEHGLDYAKSEQFENAQRYKGYEHLAPNDADSVQLIETVITSLRQAIAEAEKQEPVAVKHMMEWVAFLKARSDNGQHKNIPSNLSAGACWDLAVELEQFINTHPQPKRAVSETHKWVNATMWRGLTDEERNHARQTVTYSQLAMTASEWADAVQIETERRLKEKNT